LAGIILEVVDVIPSSPSDLFLFLQRKGAGQHRLHVGIYLNRPGVWLPFALLFDRTQKPDARGFDSGVSEGVAGSWPFAISRPGAGNVAI